MRSDVFQVHNTNNWDYWEIDCRDPASRDSFGYEVEVYEMFKFGNDETINDW